MSTKVWALSAGSLLTILISLSSEKTAETKDMRSSIEGVRLINCFHAGCFKQSVASQRNLWPVESEATAYTHLVCPRLVRPCLVCHCLVHPRLVCCPPVCPPVCPHLRTPPHPYVHLQKQRMLNIPERLDIRGKCTTRTEARHSNVLMPWGDPGFPIPGERIRLYKRLTPGRQFTT